jgi:hypothetical protein
MTEKTHRKQRGPGRPFEKGRSGNPAGKPKGCLNHATRVVQDLLDGQAEALTQTAIERALAGDAVALRLCLERVCPAPKDRRLDPGAVALPELKPATLPEATAAIVQAVAAGEITPGEGQALAGLVEGHRRTLELVEIENRVAALEAKENKR